MNQTRLRVIFESEWHTLVVGVSIGVLFPLTIYRLQFILTVFWKFPEFSTEPHNHIVLYSLSLQQHFHPTPPPPSNVALIRPTFFSLSNFPFVSNSQFPSCGLLFCSFCTFYVHSLFTSGILKHMSIQEKKKRKEFCHFQTLDHTPHCHKFILCSVNRVCMHAIHVVYTQCLLASLVTALD